METIIPIIRDVLVLSYMFVLRLVVPFVITMMLGPALRKWLEASETRQAPASSEPPVPVIARS